MEVSSVQVWQHTANGLPLPGDANLDGVVNSDDYTCINNGFNNDLTGWTNGDFNHDGVVNGDDYTILDNAFNMQGTAVATSEIAVPEPADLYILAMAIAGMAAWRIRARGLKPSGCRNPNPIRPEKIRDSRIGCGVW